MCTVTYIPVKNNVFITSNRDEKQLRKKAFSPDQFRYNGCTLSGPVDAAAGGTWIAIKENGDAAVLLNGAFIPHQPCPPYRLSRGIIFLDLLTARYPSVFFSAIRLENIEPFTIILFEKGCLYQFRWDGQEKFAKQLPAARPHIWSSVTLYDATVIKKREDWFAAFLNKKPYPSRLDIMDFHQHAGDGDAANDLHMKRAGVYSTVSITCLELSQQDAAITYMDMYDNTVSRLPVALTDSTHHL